jgi:hypothetical protein
MFKRLIFGTVLLLVVPVTLVVAAPVSGAADATPPSIPLLTAVQVQDMGSFDRVTFVFSGTAAPDILEARNGTGPAVLNPQGELVQPPISGATRIGITLSPASAYDFAASPPGPSYTGPQRLSPDLPAVTELMLTQDFESTLTWTIGVRNFGVTATAQTLTSPGRVQVDVPHGGTPAVTLAPSFTG